MFLNFCVGLELESLLDQYQFVMPESLYTFTVLHVPDIYYTNTWGYSIVKRTHLFD